MWRLAYVLFALILLNFSVDCCAEKLGRNMQFLHIRQTDTLGRVTAETSGYRPDRYVGLFYFVWFGRSQENAPDTTRLLQSHEKELFDPRDDTGIAPPGAMYYFNKPLYGYYSSTDRWVIRKHIELFTMAGIDFLALDQSNAVIDKAAVEALLEELLCYQAEGWNVPKVVFYTNLDCQKTLSEIYETFCKSGKYDSLWFYGPYKKPLIVAHKKDVTDEKLRDYFHFRPAQWPGYEYEYYPDGVPFCDLHRPQRTHENLITVSVAQHNAYIFSYGVKEDPKYPLTGRTNYGRGYTKAAPGNGDTNAILAGANIQEEWDYAIEQDPEIVFVTGWNEWATNKRLPEHEDQTVAWFVDSFNTEFSRDIEMTATRGYVFDEKKGKYTEEGYGDNYYCQLCQNIRRYKGIGGESREEFEGRRIDLSRGAEQWQDAAAFRNISYNNEPRKDACYPMAAPVNFIRELRMAHDRSHFYVMLQTDREAVPDAGNSSLLNLLIKVNGREKEANFEGYQYVINRERSQDRASVERSVGGYHFETVGRAEYTVRENLVQVAIPLELLGIEKGSAFELELKVTDSVEKPDDLLDYYVSGEVVPLGRFNCVYRAKGETDKVGKRHFILSTDWWTDCDDAIALRILLRAHKRGELQLEAIILNACMEQSVASLEGFMNAEGVQDIPIGIDRNATDFGGKPPYQKRLAALAKKYKANEDAEDAVRLYRRILEKSTAGIEILEVGYLQAIANLLESRGDDISPKSGLELVREKVSKIWVMAGKWDEENGRENNFCRNARAIQGGIRFCELCPVPVTFLGWEIGYNVLTGSTLKANDVLYLVLSDHGSAKGRCSWDPMLVTLAIEGNESRAGYDTVWGTASVDPKGLCHFEKNENGKHCFVIKAEPNDYYKDRINALIE